GNVLAATPERETTMKKLTTAERIAAMKARAEGPERRVRRGAEMRVALQDRLAGMLLPLHGLPVTPGGEGWVGAPRQGVESDGLGETTCELWRFLPAGCLENLITFTITADHDGTRAWITHDGDEIDVETALDLATAVVESRFRVPTVTT